MSEVKIGKTVIETLTSGMYEDARFVYREYIQNAADQIDRAVELGILPNAREGKIHITINVKKKQIIIEDNATGVKSNEFFSLLANIASSTKDRTKNKGFRGIGRLGGLGYCSTLVFETSYKGETAKSKMTWDADKLHHMLNDHKLDIDAASLVSAVINHEIDSCAEDEHFFKITLDKVSNSDLLCKKSIEEYLSMVAPVPFSPAFLFKDEIHKKLIEEGLSIDEYCIYINTDQLYKAYNSKFFESAPPSQKSYDAVFNIDTFKIENSKKELLAWGWFGVSTFDRQIPPKGNIARGLRLRKANIQIGSEDALVKLHKEQRGNFYFIGEIHAFHPDLIPNSRRDYFNENVASKFLDRKLMELFHGKFYKLYHDANKLKNAVKRINSLKKAQDEYNEKIISGGFSSKQQEIELKETIEKAAVEAEAKVKELNRFKEKAAEDSTLGKLFTKIVEEKEVSFEVNTDIVSEPTNGKLKYRSQKLSKLDNKGRKIIGKVYEIIDLMLPDLKDRGEELKNKIEEEFK